MICNENEFWEKVNFLRRCLSVKYVNNRVQSRSNYCDENTCNYRTSVLLLFEKNLLLKKVEDVSEKLILSISNGQIPSFTFPRRDTWKNVMFDPGVGLQMNGSSVTFSVSLRNKTSLKKFDLYYQNVNWYGKQSIVDNLIDDIACLFKVQRRELHVLATSKGCIAGDLKFKDAEGNYVDCSATISGVLVPCDIQGIECLCSEAKFVLLIEKDATFQKLLDDGFPRKFYPSILITGKGFPDVNTRELVHKLWTDLEIPILALMDADPFGIEILLIFKYGSLSLAYDVQNLATPSIQWLGIHPTDIERLKIPDDALQPLSKQDISKIADLMQRPYMTYNPEWKNQVETIHRVKKKAEIQSLSTISPSFLTEVYLPSKIRLGGWI